MTARLHERAKPQSLTLGGVGEGGFEIGLNEASRCDFSVPLGGGVLPPLGIYAKSPSAPAKVDPSTGEIVHEQPAFDPRAARWERYALKAVVNRLLPKSRTSKCLRWRIPKADSVDVMKSKDGGKAFYQGLEVCASVWACPVCAAKITERRRLELVAGVEEAKRQGLHVFLLTLTVPHELDDPLSALREKLHKAWYNLRTYRAARSLWSRVGLQGHIRALEVTDGQNGWHPHLHVLLFVPDPKPLLAACGEISRLWQHCATKAGLPTPHELHGCRIDDGSKAAQYVGKWGIEAEVTKGHVKKAKGKGGRSIWDLLRVVRERGEDADRCAARFVEFAQAFKGARQLVWSKGLKARLLVVDLDDAEIVAAPDDLASVVVAQLTDDEWARVTFAKMESAILDLAETAPDAIKPLIAALPAPPPRKPPVAAAIT